jgi:hypothetical protein
MNIKGPCLCLVMFFPFTFKKYGMFGNKVHMGRYMFTRKWSMFFCPLYFEVGKEGQYISFPPKPNTVPTPIYLSLKMVTQSPKRNLQINMAYVVNCFVQNVWNSSRDISQKGITKIFRPIVNENGYNYEFTKDLVYKKVKKLWMAID